MDNRRNNITVYHGSIVPDFKGLPFLSKRYKAVVLFASTNKELAEAYRQFHSGFLYSFDIPEPTIIHDYYGMVTYHREFYNLTKRIIKSRAPLSLIRNCVDGPNKAHLIYTLSDIYIIQDFSLIENLQRIK